MLTFQEMIIKLINYWTSKGCTWHQGYDLEVGAGTFNPATFLRCLGPEPYKAVYVEPSRRPKDGRYGQNPNRVQFYHQMQVIFKPSPYDVLELYLGSLEALGLDLSKHDIRFVHDDWENPTIGASGLGWEIWIDGMEATQFTYFQTVGGHSVKPVTAEITYGLERVAMYLQQVNSIFDLKWDDNLTYGDIYKNSEWQWSYYNFEDSNPDMWQRHFEDFEAEAQSLILRNLPIPAYDFVMKASHAFNMLDARGVISVSERARIIGRIRKLASDLSQIYIHSRQEANFPLLKESLPPSEKKTIPPSHTFKEGEKEDFLLEVGSEELPASFIEGGSRRLSEKIRTLFNIHNLSFEEITEYATPRRLCVYVKGLSSGVLPKTSEKKGPALHLAFDNEGKLTKSGEGFFRSLSLPMLSLAEVKQNKNFTIKKVNDCDYLFVQITEKAVATTALLSEELEKLILSVDFPKKMRWADLKIEYARPIQWIVALYGKEVVPFTIGNITSDRNSFGHRLKANKMIKLGHPKEYENALEKHFVIASMEKRKEVIATQVSSVEKSKGATALERESLLNQVVNLVEWPDIVVGQFDKSYLEAPKEVLVSEMVEHQKYFPLEDNHTKKLLPYFLAISNNGSSALIAKGHEKAVSSRLADGYFLFEEDLKQPLSHFCEKLKTITFHNEIGSMANKQSRIGEIAHLLHSYMPIAKKELISHAASLCKADIATQLVGEFPHLQGIMGATYARHQNEEETIAIAIQEHWYPKQEKGALPQHGLAILLSLADKLDNILSCFALDLKPTSSSDPFALRRQAFGFIKILFQEKQALPFEKVLNESFALFLRNPELSKERVELFAQKKEEILKDIILFFEGRLRTLFQQLGFTKDRIEAVLAYGVDDFYDSLVKLQAITEFSEKEHNQFTALLEMHTRTKKILQHQKPRLISKRGLERLGVKKDDERRFGEVNSAIFSKPQEKILYEEIERIENTFREPIGYVPALVQLANLQSNVKSFFDHVVVMAEDRRVLANRLALLQRLNDLFENFIDFNKLQ